MIKVTVSKKLSDGTVWTKVHYFEKEYEISHYIRRLNEMNLGIVIEIED